MRLLVDSFAERLDGFDVQVKTIGEALNLLRKRDATHIQFGALAGGEYSVDLAKYLVGLAKDGLIGPVTMSWSHSYPKSLVNELIKAMSTVDFYTGVADASGVRY